MPRDLARRARSMASIERDRLSGSQCAWISITPCRGAWPLALPSRRTAAASIAAFFGPMSLSFSRLTRAPFGFILPSVDDGREGVSDDQAVPPHTLLAAPWANGYRPRRG